VVIGSWSVGNDDQDEYGVGKAGLKWVDQLGTKFLKEAGIKLPKTLKDMFQTIGVVHSGNILLCLMNKNIWDD